MVRKSLALGVVLALIPLLSGGAFAMGNMVVTQDEMVVIPYYEGTYYTMVFAEVTNTGDKPVEFNSGLLELFDPDSNSLSSSDIYYCYPPVLAPGEVGYTYSVNYVDAPSGEDIADFMLTMTGKGSISQTVVRLDATARYEQITDDYGTYDYLVAEIQNNGEDVLSNGQVVFVMKDEGGKILYVTSSYWDWYDSGLMPGSTMRIRYQVDSYYVDYMTQNNIVPATVEAVAFFSTYTY